VRVLLDPNIYISFLLAPAGSRSPIVEILLAAANQKFVLVLPREAVDEIRRKVREKPYLSHRITPDDVEALITGIMEIAIVAARLTGDVPRVVRDPKDDYIVAHAVRESVDVVVTGDKDLLALGEHRGVRFAAPAAFALEQML
jgi:uncharacterized protein